MFLQRVRGDLGVKQEPWNGVGREIGLNLSWRLQVTKRLFRGAPVRYSGGGTGFRETPATRGTQARLTHLW